MRRVWVITKRINDYNQEGDYLVAVFNNKPSEEDIRGLGLPIFSIEHLLKGGGRYSNEDIWFYLSELDIGTKYIEKQY